VISREVALFLPFFIYMQKLGASIRRTHAEVSQADLKESATPKRSSGTDRGPKIRPAHYGGWLITIFTIVERGRRKENISKMRWARNDLLFLD